MSGDLICTIENGVKTIIFNRPSMKNAFNRNIYKSLSRILNEDAQNDSIIVTILTGKGDFFTSGNDLKEAVANASDVSSVKNMIDAFITYPKILIALVNGPAIGIGVTILLLCDVVYASKTATFTTPFVPLGLCAEACSSYTFPRTLGRSMASEMILLGKKLSAHEAYHFGLVSRLFDLGDIHSVLRELRKYGELPVNSVKTNKKLITTNLENTLLKCNEREMKHLVECLTSEDCMNAMVKFMSRKSKL